MGHLIRTLPVLHSLLPHSYQSHGPPTLLALVPFPILIADRCNPWNYLGSSCIPFPRKASRCSDGTPEAPLQCISAAPSPMRMDSQTFDAPSRHKIMYCTYCTQCTETTERRRQKGKEQLASGQHASISISELARGYCHSASVLAAAHEVLSQVFQVPVSRYSGIQLVSPSTTQGYQSIINDGGHPTATMTV